MLNATKVHWDTMALKEVDKHCGISIGYQINVTWLLAQE
jgi:hypothetical protein